MQQGILVLLKGVALFGDGAFNGLAKSLCKLAKVIDTDSNLIGSFY